MPLEHPWTTGYPAQQDAGTHGASQQPDLVDDSTPGAADGDRIIVSQLLALRDKVHAACLKLGADNKLPVESIADVLDLGVSGAQALKLLKRVAAPTYSADRGFLYTKDMGGGAIELFYEDAAGTEIQITENGTILGSGPKNNYLGSGAAPTVNDDGTLGYTRGSRWIGNDIDFVCMDPATGAAVWEATTVHTDTHAIHDDTPGEINALDPKVAAVDDDLVVIEDSEDGNAKKKVKLSDLPGGGGGGSLDRMLVISDDSEHAEAGISYDQKKFFRIVLDSNKRPTAWRVVIELWNEGGNGTTDTAEFLFECGGESKDTLELDAIATAEGNIVSGTLPITYTDVGGGNELVDDPMTASLKIRVKPASSGEARLKYSDVYLIY